jgi:uncharacterized protein with HEPN domain
MLSRTCEAISRHTEAIDRTAFEANALVCDAVERCLERISEAITELGDRADLLLPGLPWHKIRAFETSYDMNMTT